MTLVVANISAIDKFDINDPLFAQLDEDQINNEQHRKRQEEMHKRFEQLKLIKMLELLDLDEDSEAQFISLYRQHHKDMKEIMRSRNELIRELRVLLGSQSDDKQLYDEIFGKINNIDIKQIELIHSYFTKAKSVLTYEQIGKLYIFRARFGPELMGKIRDFRQHQKPGGRGMKNRYQPYDK
jgi:hypothetical protein